MLQRIQTIYLLLGFLVMTVLPLIFPLWYTNNEPKAFYVKFSLVFMVLFGLSALFYLISISQFKKRSFQFFMNRLNMILNFILLGSFIYHSLNLSGETIVSEKGIGMLLPSISIVLLALANRAIKKDEDLVKSVDRLR